MNHESLVSMAVKHGMPNTNTMQRIFRMRRRDFLAATFGAMSVCAAVSCMWISFFIELDPMNHAMPFNIRQAMHPQGTYTAEDILQSSQTSDTSHSNTLGAAACLCVMDDNHLLKGTCEL